MGRTGVCGVSFLPGPGRTVLCTWRVCVGLEVGPSRFLWKPRSLPSLRSSSIILHRGRGEMGRVGTLVPASTLSLELGLSAWGSQSCQTLVSLEESIPPTHHPQRNNES